jgi:hemerythrin
MALFIWKDEYSVNIKQIDEQHKKLVAILNELHSAMLTGKATDSLGIILDELLDYTKYHFKTEEDLMKEHNYTHYTIHKDNHDEFVTKILQFYDEFKSGKKAISIDLMFFLRDWLINHINGTDKMYSQFFNNRGIL